MPYLAPDAPIPITSCAPRLAEINASPQIQTGSACPAWKKSLLVFMNRFSAKPMPSTKTKYNSMISQSTNVRFTRVRRHLPQARILEVAASESVTTSQVKRRNPNVRGFRSLVHKVEVVIHQLASPAGNINSPP